MNVLFLYKDYHPIFGGIENHIRLLAEGLGAGGVDARVLVTNIGAQTLRETIGGVPVTKTARQVNISSAPISLPYFREVWRQEQGIDIAHAHFPYPPGEIAHLLLGRSRRFVITYHSDIVKQKVLGLLYRPLLWQVLKRADLLTVSNPVMIQTSPFLRPLAEKCRVIHFGQDLSRFQRTPQRADEATALKERYGDRPLLLFVGRFRHYKGVDVLIRAMHQVDAELLLVGIGPMERAWRQVAQDEGLGHKVRFLGELSDDEVLSLYHAADIFVLPSTNRAETLGIVQIEAMACGLPVVCTELGTGTSYVNQHEVTGLVAPPNDPAALAAAINRLLADPALRMQMGAAGLKRAQDEFSLEEMIRQTLAFYAEALSLPR
jgi:glycosyltransferase involved in cell wall biosynthesis